MNKSLIIILILSLLCNIFAFLMIEENKQKIYQIKTCQDLQDMNKDLDGIYILMNNIDCANIGDKL